MTRTRDTWHAHPIAHRRGYRALTASLLRGLGEGAIFVSALGMVLFWLWMIAP